MQRIIRVMGRGERPWPEAWKRPLAKPGRPGRPGSERSIPRRRQFGSASLVDEENRGTIPVIHINSHDKHTNKHRE
jgi:hypothetical protein